VGVPACPPKPWRRREPTRSNRKPSEPSNKPARKETPPDSGKTWLAAFDTDRFHAKRVFFVAHREEILRQALDTFRRIRPEATLGLYTGTEKDPTANVLFASIQTLGKKAHLRNFGSNAFDYIVVDYIGNHRAFLLKPQTLLGLDKATERSLLLSSSSRKVNSSCPPAAWLPTSSKPSTSCARSCVPPKSPKPDVPGMRVSASDMKHGPPHSKSTTPVTTHAPSTKRMARGSRSSARWAISRKLKSGPF
jgi:hypothetical protein